MKFLFIYDNHFSRWDMGRLTHVSLRLQPPLGIPQSVFNASEFTAIQ
jgi:hypothetical protein